MSLYEGSRRLRGPIGSKLSLTVLRGSATEPHTLTLVREAAPADHVSTRPAGPGIAVVRIASFGEAVVGAVRQRVADARAAGAERLVIDLRSTVEGPLENGVAVARLFVPSGTLAQREARGQKPELVSAEPGDGTITLPAVLLVSSGTAGAAEVFAAALSGNKRAEIVGEHTLGRAGLQKLVKFSDGSALLMTWARYLTPDGKPLHGTGLEPADRIDEPEVEFGEPPPTGDPMLDAAIARLGVKAAA
jgi:carboxyl-terminal processing protease